MRMMPWPVEIVMRFLRVLRFSLMIKCVAVCYPKVGGECDECGEMGR